MSSRSRALVTLSVSAAFLVIGGTGALLYALKHSNLTAAIHTLFDLAAPAHYYALIPVGHGHPGGGDGLDPDLSTLTTAFDILDGVLVRVAR